MEFVGNKKIACFCGSSNCSGKIGEKPKDTEKKKVIKKKPKRSTGGKGDATKKPKGVDPIVAMLNKMGRKGAVKNESIEKSIKSAGSRATIKEEKTETPEFVEMQANKDFETNEEGKEPFEMQENEDTKEMKPLVEGQIIDDREFIENLSPNPEVKPIEVSKNPLVGLSAVACPSESDVKGEPVITMSPQPMEVP